MLCEGGLVRKILETKKELEGSGPQESRPRHDRTAPLISDAARRKERELAQKEVGSFSGKCIERTRMLAFAIIVYVN